MAGRDSAAAQALSEQDVTALRAEVSAGRAVTVWFTAAAVGVPAGGSAKVLAVGDVAEGDFIQVRPAGSQDAVFCSPSELTRSRPARRSAKTRQATAADDPAVGDDSASPGRAVRARRSAKTSPSPDLPGAEESADGKPAPATSGNSAVGPRAAPEPEAATPRRATAAATKPRKPTPEPEAPAPKPERPTPKSGIPAATAESAASRPETQAPAKPTPSRTRQRGDRSGGLTVTLTSTPSGDWSVEVVVGTKRVVPPTPVQATEVATVSRSLPPAATEVITSALVEARRRQEERVAQLREELDAAQRTLEQLAGD